MAGLRIGIDVGGTFTHGVVLRPPGEVLLTGRTPTTHRDQRGVAAGIATVLRDLLARLPAGYDAADVELVAHSTTQATNALLEGDVSGVHLAALAPPGERGMVRSALNSRRLDLGNGHHVNIWPKLLLDWEDATPENFPASTVGADHKSDHPYSVGEAPSRLPDRAATGSRPYVSGGTESRATAALSTVPPPGLKCTGWDGVGVPAGFQVSPELPVVVVQPLAGRHDNREGHVAAHYRASGHAAVCAGEITEVLGLQARARTAIVNAAMLPTMLATADFTEAAVRELLPHAALQVVRSDGGAMSIEQMRRQPIQSLLSGPAAGASAALHRSGLSDAVFIEVGGTSTDITLIRDGRVRHRYATVGGQQLMVPALDLRTVAVGGGSMLRADKALFGPRSAHIAGLPYLFQAVLAGLEPVTAERWTEEDAAQPYSVVRMSDGSLAAVTATDVDILMRASGPSVPKDFSVILPDESRRPLREGIRLAGALVPHKASAADRSTNRELDAEYLKETGRSLPERDSAIASVTHAYMETCGVVVEAIKDLARQHRCEQKDSVLVGGGGGAPVYYSAVAMLCGMDHAASGGPRAPRLIPDYSVISAIGAALAVTAATASRTVAQPGPQDIAELTAEVEARLAQQGAERVSTDFEYDAQRQVLTVTGRGSRPYEQGAEAKSADELAALARSVSAEAELVWESDTIQLWTTPIKPSGWFKRGGGMKGFAMDRRGRMLWQGGVLQHTPVSGGLLEARLAEVLAAKTQYTDGGPALPGLAVLADGRFIPLDQLGSAELAIEVLRWERIPAAAEACILIRAGSG
jgi:N-methylhydantoinase A/oxoprolinase/acetone carboxylase beta subunit